MQVCSNNLQKAKQQVLHEMSGRVCLCLIGKHLGQPFCFLQLCITDCHSHQRKCKQGFNKLIL